MNVQHHRPRILFVDDDELIRETFALFFNQAGWHYQVVANGQEALSRTKGGQFDLVITDLMMPAMSGLELLRAVRQTKPNQPFLIVTGLADTREAIQALKEGALDIIQKPVDFDALERSVARIVDSNRHRTSQTTVYHYLQSEESNYIFTSSQLADQKINLPLLERLQEVGLLDLSTKLKIELAFQEAVTNSLDHGNLELESVWKEQIAENGIDHYSVVKRQRLGEAKYAHRTISIQLRYMPSVVTICIHDQGNGFSFSPPPPIPDTQSLNAYGRGLTIMYGCMDEVRYSEGGRKVTLVKRITSSEVH